VWRKDVIEAPGAPGGWVVSVVDPRGQPAGQALWAEKSPLALRLLTRRTHAEEPVDAAWFRARLQASIARRATFGRESLRLVHGEADGLPGLFVDRYRDRLVVQTLAEGMDTRKEGLAATLEELTGAVQVVCRDDGSGRDFEQVPRESRVLRGPKETEVEWREGDNVFRTDLLNDMKTGAFLDQAENHLRSGELGRGRALDAFSYHGGFALALATRCDSVLALEQDPTAAARLSENARRNGRKNVEAREANAFDVLHQLDRDGERFDTVVLDPPGLAKRKEGARTALRAYRELNVRALRLLRPGGLLVTCSCSGKVKPADFEEMLLGAADDVRRPVQILERRGPAADHPVLGGLPETEYLKAFFVRPL
jgi:23S rRNA (cytosine1962-C5)-methyltransferase